MCATSAHGASETKLSQPHWNSRPVSSSRTVMARVGRQAELGQSDVHGGLVGVVAVQVHDHDQRVSLAGAGQLGRACGGANAKMLGSEVGSTVRLW